MQKGRIALALLLCLTLAGCADARQAREAVPEEKRLVVYTSHKADVYPAIIEEFERRTGIWVQVETGGTNELLARIAREDGTAGADLMFGGGVESLQAYQDYFLSYDGEALARVDASYRPSGNFAPFSSLPLVLIYQPRLVETPPTGWADLLSPRWRGQIAFADPAVSGSSYTALATMLQCLPGEKEALIAAFVDNLDGRMLSGSGEVVGAVAAGQYLLGVTLEETARKAIAAGADVAMAYPEEGTSAVPDGVALLRGAKHPQNARMFIDFVLGADVQGRLSEMLYRRPVLSADYLSVDAQDAPRLCDYDIAWASARQSEVLACFAACVGGGQPQ